MLLVFNNNSNNSDTYLWDFGDGNISTEESPMHTYDEEGIYQVTLTVTNECGNDVIVTDINITEGLMANFFAEELSGCAPFVLTLVDQSQGASSYTWNVTGPENYTSTEENPTFTLNTAGVYNVSLSVSNGTISDVRQRVDYITVGDVPTAEFTVVREQLTFNFDADVENADSFEWSFGDGNSSTEEDPTHTYEEEGSYLVRLITSNGCGEFIASTTVSALSIPQASFTSDVNDGCAPLEVRYESTSLNASTLLWNFEGGAPAMSTAANPTITYNEPGVYQVTLTATSPAGEDQVIVEEYITVYEAPEEEFELTINDLIVEVEYDGEGTDIEWDFGDDRGTSNDPNVKYTYGESGEYIITLTGTNICGPFTITKTIDVISTGIEDIAGVDLKIFPNPVFNTINIELSLTQKSVVDIKLLNILGQTVKSYSGNNEAVDHKLSIDVTGLSAGTYFMIFNGKNIDLNRKILILSK